MKKCFRKKSNQVGSAFLSRPHPEGSRLFVGSGCNCILLSFGYKVFAKMFQFEKTLENKNSSLISISYLLCTTTTTSTTFLHKKNISTSFLKIFEGCLTMTIKNYCNLLQFTTKRKNTKINSIMIW